MKLFRQQIFDGTADLRNSQHIFKWFIMDSGSFSKPIKNAGNISLAASEQIKLFVKRFSLYHHLIHMHVLIVYQQ